MPVRSVTRRAWLLWTIAISVYIAAVFHRSSLGVAGLRATERFGVGPAALATFTVLQLAVYAAMQVPTGLLVDRFGPRVTLTAATILLGVGSIGFGLAHSYPVALITRAVLGVGDSMTWVSVMRVVAGQFPAKVYPLVMSLSSMLGMTGNLVATLPLTLMLAGLGWTTTFLATGLGTASFGAVVVSTLRVRNEPGHAGGAPTMRAVLRGVAQAWRVPGTRLGFWVHFSTMSGPATLGLLWGFPYLVRGQGLSPVAADEVLGAVVIANLLTSPILGAITSHRPGLRMPIAVGYLGMAALLWPLLVDGRPLPFAALIVIFMLLAVGGPIATVGFMLARDYNPLHRVGTATGVVNVGGFFATTVATLAVGVLVGFVGYRTGLLAVVAVVGLGAWRLIVWWRRARAHALAAQARGESVPVQVRRRRWDAVIPVDEPGVGPVA